MENKKNLIIWANCQGGSIDFMLSKYHSDKFNIFYYSNFEYINNNIIIPNTFLIADYFLYQNYSNKDNVIYDLDHIKKNLNINCKLLSFPTLHSINLLFCYDTNDPLNKKTISHLYPHGKFFYGMNNLKIMIEKYKMIENKNTIIEKIIEEILSDNYIDKEQIDYYYDRSFTFLETKALSSDIQNIYYYIRENFKKIRLWHNPNHPTGILLNQLIIEIFNKLELYYDNSDENIKLLDNMLNDWVIPILPCVKKYYNLNFDDNCSSKYHLDITNTRTYIYKYINDLYFNNDI